MARLIPYRPLLHARCSCCFKRIANRRATPGVQLFCCYECALSWYQTFKKKMAAQSRSITRGYDEDM